MQDLPHTTFLENLPSFIAGGLPPDERARMAAHAAICAACDAALADALAADAKINDLFAPVRPPADYEDALIAHFRHDTTRPHRIAHPAWRFAGGIAAAVLLGFIGLAGSHRLQSNGGIASLHFPSVPSLLSHLSPTRADRAAIQQAYKSDGPVPLVYGRASSTENNGRTPVAWYFDSNGDSQYGFRTSDAAAPPEVHGRAVDHSETRGSTRAPANWAEQGIDRNAKPNTTTWQIAGGTFVDGTVNGAGTLTLPVGGTVQLGTAAQPPLGLPQIARESNTTTYTIEDQKKLPASMGRQERNLTVNLRAPATPQQPSDTPDFYFATTIAKDNLAKTTANNLYFRPPTVRDPAAPEPTLRRVLTSDGPANAGDSIQIVNGNVNGTVAGKPAEVAVTEAKGGRMAYDEVTLGDLSEKASKETPARGEDKPKSVANANATVDFAEDATAAQHTGIVDPVTPTTTTTPTTTSPAAIAQRKIIRNGNMDFEVDAFDSAAMQVTKIATEEGGYVSSTDSEKLPNGKVKGTITLRVPPEHLDTLVLKLRGLGDLKSQKIAAQDVTKQYTDLEGQLKAARTMEQRLLDIIKTGKGEVKDLVEAEKQLGVYREKIEQVEGELRYYNNLVSLSTLNVTLYERDIRAASAAFEIEEIQAGIETEDVEKSRQEALKSIDAAKGRVVESTMKNHGAGQYEAHIVAEVGPDAAGPVLDRLKQLGRVARLDVDRKQQTTGGTGAPSPAVKLERRATRFTISLYNLANVEPRETVNVALAAVNVEEAYKTLVAAAAKAESDGDGRIVTRTLGGQRPGQESAGLVLEIRAEQADAMETAIRAAGEVMNLTSMENPDRQNTTAAKRKFSVTIGPISQVEPRETQTIQARAKDVPAVYARILAALNAPTNAPDAKRAIPVRVRTSQLNEQDLKNVSASLDFDVPRAEVQPLLAQAFNGKDAEVTARNVARSADTQNTLDSKVRISLALYDANQGPPRESTRMAVEVPDVAAALNQAVAAAPPGARVLERRETRHPDGVVTGSLVLDVPAEAAGSAADALAHQGTVKERESARNDAVPDGALARAQFDVRFGTPAPVIGANKGVSVSLREGLAKAVEGLLFSLQLLVVGLFLVVPFLLVAWIVWKLVRRKNRAAKTTIATPSPL